MSLVARFINCFKTMVPFKNLSFKITPDRYYLVLPTYMAEIQFICNTSRLLGFFGTLKVQTYLLQIKLADFGMAKHVAAIFKIGNSKDMPDIPDSLSHDAKDFVRLCLQRNPSERPTASQLLDHPFIREQMTTRSSNKKLTKEAFPYAFEGSRTPPVLELHSSRTSITLGDVDHTMKPSVTTSRAIRSPTDNSRVITSLPVSPCSSPLRQYGAQHNSCFRSPPHPSYAMMGQSNYNLNEYPSYSRANTSHS